MKVETLETLILLLLFAVPGVVFVFTYSRVISYSKRVDFIRKQFPFEAILVYITASAIIHVLLASVVLMIVITIAWIFQIPDIISVLVRPLQNWETTSIFQLALPISTIFTYFVLSLVIAYRAGKSWKKRYKPSVPIWLKALVELLFRAENEDEKAQIELLFKNGMEFDGEWENLRYYVGNPDTFEIAIRQPKKKLVFYVESSNLKELTASWGGESKRVVFKSADKVNLE